ncbi:MAG: XdhC/CoxI family protein [Candidatus Caldatribacteriota bacterium]|nr:XdhC/CoxI family protein [Candidatus Caldatribacteriota bacterium]
MTKIMEEVLKRVNNGETVALVTIVEAKGSIPGEVGSKMVINNSGLIAGTIGGGIIEAKVIEKAKEAIESGENQSLNYHLTKEEAKLDKGIICGGELKIFIDILKPKEEVVIFGAGHIGLCLSKLAKIVGFEVIIIDERKEFANQERFSEAKQIINKKPGKALNNIKITPFTYVVIVTKGHLEDEEALFSVINLNVGYIGMIGSSKKNEVIFQHLKEKGISEEKIKKVYTPIGVDIGAQTPEEIAISIMAEIIRVKRKKSSKQR